ncbi:M48 family metalloprotease [Microbulbifer thermotolerans]|uniref:Uncharacterized protein n=1 Tax=Microbulbifer thermotolerans TaxID=252514 RepID=A0A143HL15_MICTH|nr:hypothetical protein [Microbulbifer thermotolerans]AMX02415.1 hypothetical protein A3224_07310 [Microbulbifer thermotolerans]
MSGQEKYQLVSAGKTLRARAPEEVLRDAAQAFSIPLSQARRLLLKGWVIKDQLSSKQALEYRVRLQQIGLKVEVFPAGKFDNRALVARMQFAQKRRARASAQSVKKAARVKPDSPTAAAPSAEKPRDSARAQIDALFVEASPAVSESPAEKMQLLLGLFPAALVPALFVFLAGVCAYGAASALWRIPQAVFAGQFSALTAVGSLFAILMAAFVAALFVWPFFAGRRLAQPEWRAVPLKRQEAPGLYLLLEVLAEKAGLPVADRISVTAGVEVLTQPGLTDIRHQRLPLNIGLAAVRSLSGGEMLALVAQALGIYRGQLSGLATWLVLDSARRLQRMQWALENERHILAPKGEPRGLKSLHTFFAACGGVLLPLVDRLCEWHRLLTGALARLLVRRGDAWAAQILGSEGYAHFAEKWHQLIHAELLVSEINREASVSGQRLRDYPEAVHWILNNLDGETRSNIELAMAQTSDAWDVTQPPDNDRIAAVEALNLQPLVGRDFSFRKLFDNPEAAAEAVSALVAPDGARPVENRQLLCVSKEAEQAQKVLGEYFNQMPPRRFLALELPAGETMQSMDLQETVDWLRSKLVELRELEQRGEELRARGAAMQLGTGLIKIQEKIDPRAFFLSGATPAAAEECIRDNRVQRGELQQQLTQIHRVFFLRVQRALQSMSAAERQPAQRQLAALRAYSDLALRLEKLESYVDILSLMIDRLSLQAAQRELVQKYFLMAGQALEGLLTAVKASADLRALGLDTALRERLGDTASMALPQRRQELVDALQALELRSKNACAAIYEHYRIQLARLVELCLKREQALQIRPLRLVKQV